MPLTIELTPESRECLMRHFKDRSKPYLALEGASRVELAGIDVYSFVCDEVDANILLAIAVDHCPPAVGDIKNALRAAKRTALRD
jgi:hypothetical protein